jgi:hypothetical protein
MSEGERAIYAKLTERFTPSELSVQDVSGSFRTYNYRRVRACIEVFLILLMPANVRLALQEGAALSTPSRSRVQHSRD